MRNHPWLAACAIAGSALSLPVQAQPNPPPLTNPSPAPSAGRISMAAAVDAAWQRAVAAQEARGLRQRADAERSAASSLWAAPPALQLSHRNDRWQRNAGQQETEIGLAWPLWLPGQRAARGAVADAAVAAADVSQAAARLRMAGEVREAAWAIHALEAELVQADALLRSLQTLAEDVERRVRAGDMARADALAARAELLGATAQQTEVRQRLVQARGQWKLLTGLEALVDAQADAQTDAQAEAQADAREAARTPDTAAPVTLALHPELRYAALATEHARKRVALVQASRRDPPELSLGFRQDTPGRSAGPQNSITIGLRLPFGTDDRNQPLQAAALSELELAQAREQRLRDRLDADLAAALAAQATTQQQLLAERDRAALLRERALLIDKSFRAGETPLPDLLRALSAAAQAEASLARQQAALGLARARLHQASGLLP